MQLHTWGVVLPSAGNPSSVEHQETGSKQDSSKLRVTEVIKLKELLKLVTADAYAVATTA